MHSFNDRDHTIIRRPLAKKYASLLEEFADIFDEKLPFAKAYDHLSQLFEALRKANLKVNASKCTFGQPQALFLGYQVSPERSKLPPAKVEAIKSYSKPATATE